MYRLSIVPVLVLLAITFVTGPALPRVMESADAVVAAKAMPAVVNIATWKLRPPTEPGGTPRRVKTYGSGFIIDPSGIIVTNRHVIDSALDIKVIFDNGDRASGKLLAVAPMTDLAVVKADIDRALPVLQWADSSDLRVGDGVLAIGNPLGFGMSVTAGIVSALHRDVQDTPFDDYIQTDAAINHGNSGGPLLNLEGKVVGVDTALYNPNDVGGFIGIGLAISSKTAEFVVRHMLDPQQPRPGWIGVKLQDLTPDLAEAVGLPLARGSIVAAVEPEGPAARAALRPGDILIAIGDTKEASSRAFMRDIVEIPIGEPAHLRVWRDGKEHTVSVTVAEWPKIVSEGALMTPSAEAMSHLPPHSGMELAPLTDAARKQYGLDEKLNGALVASVEKDSEANDLGIAPGDVITAVLGAPVMAPEDVHRAMQKAHEERRPSLALLVQSRSGGVRWVSLSISPTGL
jgi:serine protease Do